MKMSEEQIRGNITTIEQELLLLILDELRKRELPKKRGIMEENFAFNEPLPFDDVEEVKTEKPKQKRGKPARKKTQK